MPLSTAGRSVVSAYPPRRSSDMLRSPIHLRPTTHAADSTRFQSTIADLASPPLPFVPSSPLPPPSDRDYVLKFRQQPRQARMCGVGDKGAWTSLTSATLPGRALTCARVPSTADRRPIDPPPVVQLTVVEKSTLGASTKGNQQLSARDKATAASSSRSRQKDAASGVEDQAAGQTYLQSRSFLCLPNPRRGRFWLLTPAWPLSSARAHAQTRTT